MVAHRRAPSASLPAAAGAAIALGIVLGLGAQIAGDLRPGLGWVGALGGPWLVTAFAAGALAASARTAALAGALALGTGTAAYYAAMVGTAGPGALGYAVIVGAAWGLVALAVGATFGAAGGLWRAHDDLRSAGAAALLAGALVGEAALLAAIWDARPALLVVGAQLGAGLTLPLVLLRGASTRLVAVALAIGLAVACGVAEAELRDALRGVGWAGR